MQISGTAWPAIGNSISRTPICRWRSRYYRRATSINLGSPFYWMDFAGAYETAGDASQAEQAFRKARQFYPISAEAAWRFGNFLLRQGRFPEAFQQIHEAVVSNSKLTALAVSLCWRSTHDIDRILKTVLPDEQEQNWGAIQFFVQEREPVPAMAVWTRIAGHVPPFLYQTLFRCWTCLSAPAMPRMRKRCGIRRCGREEWHRGQTPPGSLVWNGGFEQEPLNGGFDWRVIPAEGAEMAWDEQIVHSGRRSLRVDFDGKANVDFRMFGSMSPFSLPHDIALAHSSAPRI